MLALTLLLLADIGPPPPECAADRDCVLTTFAGCCGDCCPGSMVRAAPKGKDERAECRTMNCTSASCTGVKCPAEKPDQALYVPACVARRCEAVLKTAQCRVAADCHLVEIAPVDPPCDGTSCCCPVKKAQPLDAGVPASITHCPRCPPEPPARAACERGQCTVVHYTPGSKKR
jgi:hypothetical protein